MSTFSFPPCQAVPRDAAAGLPRRDHVDARRATTAQRYVVGVRLPATVTVNAYTPAAAERAAAGMLVTALRDMPVGFLRTRQPSPRPAGHPVTDAITAVRITGDTAHPRPRGQRIYTVAAVVLIGVTLTAPDRDDARDTAARQLRGELFGRQPRDVRLHTRQLTVTWVRKLNTPPRAATPPAAFSR